MEPSARRILVGDSAPLSDSNASNFATQLEAMIQRIVSKEVAELKKTIVRDVITELSAQLRCQSGYR